MQRPLLVSVLALALSTSASAAVFTASATAPDAPDTSPGDGLCADATGTCTLRAAIMETNALAGADVVNLASGEYEISIAGAGEDLSATGDLDIVDDLELSGVTAAASVIDANRLDRVLHVLAGATVVVRDLQVTGGSTGATTAVFTTDARGQGILNAGDLTVVRLNVSHNTPVGATGTGRDGGGIASAEASKLRVLQSVIEANGKEGLWGGGIYGIDATITVEGSTIRNNGANRGGGITTRGGHLHLLQSAVTDNRVFDAGGGIYVGTAGEMLGEALVEASLIARNHTYDRGGGISGSAVTIVNSTISHNYAGFQCGGVVGAVLIANSTITGNRVRGTNPSNFGGGVCSTGTVRNSVIAANHAPNNPDCRSGPVSGGHNFIGDATDCSFVATTGDQVGKGAAPLDPRLLSLADNGGPTHSHLPMADSPLLDAGNPVLAGTHADACEATDQRGSVRPIDGNHDGAARCDIGAVELAFECSDGVDNDGDGLVDHPLDPNCIAPTSPSERSECDDGVDNDGDGLQDGDDPSCPHPGLPTERSACNDGMDNDGDGLVDFDGGASASQNGALCINGRPFDVCRRVATNCQGAPDPECIEPWDLSEHRAGCGLGPELAALLPGLLWLHRKRRPRQIAAIP